MNVPRERRCPRLRRQPRDRSPSVVISQQINAVPRYSPPQHRLYPTSASSSRHGWPSGQTPWSGSRSECVATSEA